ncbi:MAG: tol-pal system protein YbgF [Gammaproteobacteria bacterium]|nr:MAG: tol-pal system protein YbgF [Gammaproteobacteria bacterium]
MNLSINKILHRYVIVVFVCNIFSVSVGLAASSQNKRQDAAIIKLKKDVRILKNKSGNNQMGALLQQNEQLRIDSQELRGTIETLQYKLKKNEDRQKNLYNDLNIRIKKLESNKSFSSNNNSINNSNTNYSTTTDVGKKDYQKSLSFLKQGKYNKAIKSFNSFLKKHKTNNEYSDNAQYWLAESYYALKKYDIALNEFLNLVEGYPNSDKNPDAQIKIAYCYYELGYKKEARTIFKYIIDTYPNTENAKLSQKKLKNF